MYYNYKNKYLVIKVLYSIYITISGVCLYIYIDMKFSVLDTLEQYFIKMPFNQVISNYRLLVFRDFF